MDYLAGTVLDLWLKGEGFNIRDSKMKQLAEKMAGKGELNVPIMKRLTRSVDRLNELHYTAHWEARAGGPRLFLGNCPYASIISDHPELCQMDRLFLASTLVAEVTQISKLKISEKGLPFCVFQIN